MALADSLATRAQTLGQNLIHDLSPWYENGVFYVFDMSDYHRKGLPHAALMATLCNDPNISASLKANYIAKITEIVNFSINTNMNSAHNYYVDGGLDPYGYYGQYPDAQAMNLNYIPGATVTIEQVNDLAWILWQLPYSNFSGNQWATWLNVLQATTTELDARPGNSITTFYINGNYNAQLLGCYWMTALLSTGAQKLYFQDCYERAYNFLVKPSLTSATWTGWGLTIDVSGSQPDWADYQVHLTETNTRVVGGAGWDLDWGYSQVQLDALARVFLVNRDSRLIRIINGLTNKIAPRWNRSTHILDCSSGSRTNQPNIGYTGCYFEIQALMGAKGLSTLDLTTAECLARWDNAMIANLSGDSTTGYYLHQGSLSRAIAPVLAAARIQIAATVAAS